MMAMMRTIYYEHSLIMTDGDHENNNEDNNNYDN